MSTNSIFKGDNTAAFGNNFITVTIKNPLLYPISKLIAVTNSGTGIPNKQFTDENNFQSETITLIINYSSEETCKLNQGSNLLNMVAYDLEGRQYTCKQSLTFYSKNGVISRNGQSCC